MSTPMISVRDLSKHFVVAKRGPGLKGAVRQLFAPKHEVVKAVDSVSFDIEPGEAVGYIGRNGAGKSTTVKILTGILVPTSGGVVVDGLVPYRKRAANGKKIAVVFGQRTHLRWDTPVLESFRLLREIYEVPRATYERNLALFTQLLELDDLLSRPVRKLSLGQRMKCDLAGAFLHDPLIAYLDEPTIGLDILVKEKVRRFIKEVNREKGTTIILTTHDLRDIEDICRRAIIIDKGSIVFDGALDEIKRKYGQHTILHFDVKERMTDARSIPLALLPGMEVQEVSGHTLVVRADRSVISAAAAARHVMDALEVVDMGIQETSIESVVKRIYQER
jgi:ABC-2 type transport system ATP-binding protein